MAEPPLAIELIDREIAKHEQELKKHLALRQHAEKEVQIQQDCIDLYSGFILDLQQSKEAILAAQTPVITAEPPYCE